MDFLIYGAVVMLLLLYVLLSAIDQTLAGVIIVSKKRAMTARKDTKHSHSSPPLLSTPSTGVDITG